MEQSQLTSVYYKADLNIIKKLRVKKFFGYILGFIILALIAVIIYLLFNRFYYSDFSQNKFLYLYFVFSLLVVIVEFIKYNRMSKLYKDYNIIINKKNDDIDNIEVNFKKPKYEVCYTIRNITEIERKKYIDIKGDIMAEYDYLIDLNANTSGYYNDLRIPTYFENIDEIYDSIIQFKEQLVEKK